MKTYLAKPSEVRRDWHVVDATDLVLGRMSSKVARVLMGKHKPQYTPHVDTGDFVVVVNCAKVRTTGSKASSKEYPYYTGWRGGLKTQSYRELIERDPGRIVRLAVRRMLPKSKLGRQMLRKLKTYAGDAHPHGAQQPRPLDLQKI